MAIDKSQITHHSECIPGLIRNEIYKYDDILYKETYDEETGKLITGDVKMFNGIKVCSVYDDGSIRVTLPTDLAVDHKSLMLLINDLQRLDDFLAAVVKNYH